MARELKGDTIELYSSGGKGFEVEADRDCRAYGNVGIGKSPTYAVDVTTANEIVAQFASSDADATIILKDDTYEWHNRISSGEYQIYDATNALIPVKIATNSATNALQIDASGYVQLLSRLGLGVSPTYALDISSADDVTGRFKSTDADNAVEIADNTYRWQHRIASGEYQVYDATNTMAPLRIAPNSAADSLVIDASGDTTLGGSLKGVNAYGSIVRSASHTRDLSVEDTWYTIENWSAGTPLLNVTSQHTSHRLRIDKTGYYLVLGRATILQNTTGIIPDMALGLFKNTSTLLTETEVFFRTNDTANHDHGGSAADAQVDLPIPVSTFAVVSLANTDTIEMKVRYTNTVGSTVNMTSSFHYLSVAMVSTE